MGSIVLYIIEWAFALLVLLAIYKAVFSGTTFHRFNRFYLLGATLLSALLPLVHVTITDRTPVAAGLSIEETGFARELSGTFTFADESDVIWPDDPELITGSPEPEHKTSLWAVMLIGTYAIYVLTLIIGWSRGIIRARKFLRGKPRRRLSRTVWLVTHNEQYGPFSWMNYIVISDMESGFARLASLRHEYSHVRLMHSVDLIILLACTTVNPVCWLVLQEIKIVHEYEADDEVINRYGIHEQDYQRLLLIKAVGAEAYALASSFNLNIKKRIIMMNKNKTRTRRLMWLLLLIPMLGMTSVLFARTEEAFNFDIASQKGTVTVKGKVVDEKGKPIANAIVSETRPGPAVGFILHGFTDKNGEFSFNTVEMNEELGIGKEGYGSVSIKDYYEKDLLITLTKGGEMKGTAIVVKERNLMRVIVKANGKVRVINGAVNKDVDPADLKEIAIQFISNPKNDSKLPVLEEYDIEGFKPVTTTLKHIIVVEREKGVSLESREAAYGMIMKAYVELRDRWCRQEFGHVYKDCTQEQKSICHGMYANKVIIPEVRYFCDIKLHIRKSAIVAQKQLIDQNSADPVDYSIQEESGELLGVIRALEQYLDRITADGDTRIRGVELEIGSNADELLVLEVMDVLRKKNVISYKITTVDLSKRNSLSLKVTGGKPGAGSMIGGLITDNDGPITMANVTERDDKNRIVSHAITDINGEFLMRMVNPDDKLEINASGHMVIQCFITGTRFEVRLPQGDGFEFIHNNQEPAGSNDATEDGVYTTVDDMPEFPGGMASYIQFLSKNLNYPAQAKENGIQGRVLVSFIVNENGSLSDFRIDKSSANDELDKEAVRVLKTMPNWKPGSQDGKPVKVRYQMPINFRNN